MPGARYPTRRSTFSRVALPCAKRVRRPTVAEASDILFRQPAAAAGQEDESGKRHRLRGRQDPGLARTKPQAPTFEENGGPVPPFLQRRRVVVERREVVDMTETLRAQNFLAEVVEPVEMDIREELAGQVADGKPAAARERREQVVARMRWTGSRGSSTIRQSQGATAGDAAPQVALQDLVVDGRKMDVTAQDMAEAVAEPFVPGHGVPLPLRLA